MDIFNLIAGACSIIGLFVSVFMASKIVKMSNANNNNHGGINQGDGEQNIASEYSAIGGSRVIHNDYRNANIQGEIDQFPVLTESCYPIYAENYDRYSSGITKNSCEMISIDKKDVMVFAVDFTDTVSQPDINRFVGYSIKSLPMKDWRSFVEKDFVLSFNYKNSGTIKEIWIEITNFVLNKKIYKNKISLSKDTNEFRLHLKDFYNVIEDWKSVDEICFVFFPEECIGQRGTVYITQTVLGINE